MAGTIRKLTVCVVFKKKQWDGMFLFRDSSVGMFALWLVCCIDRCFDPGSGSVSFVLHVL